jgi:SOS-response transcriptional repressor LexA
MMPPVTRRQADLIAAIRRLTIDGVPPSIGELCGALGLKGRGNVHNLLTSLRRRGLVEWQPFKARSIRLIEDAWAHLDTMSDAELEALRIRIGIVQEDRARAT